MELSKGIQKFGFRRWYERQLIESHLYLISGILCLFTVLACLEGFNRHLPAWEMLMRFAAILAGSLVCLWTFRRYLVMLQAAEQAAEHSICEKCAEYRGLELSGTAATARSGIAEHGSTAPVGVRCRRCGHEWTIGQSS